MFYFPVDRVSFPFPHDVHDYLVDEVKFFFVVICLVSWFDF